MQIIGRIHRLGRHTGKRPVIVYLQDFNEKKAIFANVTKLKGSKINIQNDFSQQTLRKRKLLWESAKTDKNDGKKVYLVNDRLKIDKDEYTWDETKGQRVKVAKQAPTPSPLPVISEP